MADVVVVDASLAIKWVLRENHTDEARDLLAQWTAQGFTLLAPSLFVYEVTNVLYRRTQRSVLTIAEVRTALQDLLAIGPELDDPIDSALSFAAMNIAQRTGRAATYDAHYLALAEREGCECWTADERLWNATHATCPYVRWIGNWRPATP